MWETEGSRSSRRWLARSALSFATSLLLLFGAELLLRVIHYPFAEKFSPNENGFGRFDSDLGWSYRPNLSTTVKVGTSATEVEYHFDSRGIRVKSPEHQLDPEAPSVLFIGGSFTMGDGVTYGDTFVGRLDALPRLGYQTVNLGVQAYGTDQALLSLERHLATFNNVAAVVYTYIDAHDIRNSNYDRRVLIPVARFLGTKPLFALDSNRRLVLARQPMKYEAYQYSRLWAAYRVTRPATRSSELTRALVSEMQRVSSAHGARFAVVSWPWQVFDTARSGRTPAALRQRDAMFDNMEIEVIDTAAHAPPNWFRMALPGNPHPNADAHARVARLLLRWLANDKAATPAAS